MVTFWVVMVLLALEVAIAIAGAAAIAATNRAEVLEKRPGETGGGIRTEGLLSGLFIWAMVEEVAVF